MKTLIRFVAAALIATTLSAGLLTQSQAQDRFPSSPVKLIVPFPSGSTTDLVARLLAQKLSKQMNGSVVVINKDGAAGIIANEYVAQAKPDGYTLLFNTSGIILTPALGQKVDYDVYKDLVPVGFVASVPLCFVVNASLPVNNVDEFIKYARANPGKLAFGSGGVGNVTQLAPLLFLQANHLNAVHVPYKGVPPLLLDLMAGRVQFAMVSLLTPDKRLKVLATTGLKRSLLFPNLPTINESAVPGFEASSWFGVMAPAGTPPAIVKQLNEEIAKALNDPDTKALLGKQGIQAGPPLTPDQYAAYLKHEDKRWGDVIRSAGVKIE